MRPRKVTLVCFDCGSPDLIVTRVADANTKKMLSETFGCMGCNREPCETITESERVRALKLLRRSESLAPDYAPVVESPSEAPVVDGFVALGGDDP